MATKTNISWTATHHPDGTVTPGATWNTIPNFPRYEVSDQGHIRSIGGPQRKVLRPICEKDDSHLYVFLYRDDDRPKVYVHRAGLLAFVGEPQPDQECRHLDGDAQNNSLRNLAWGTPQQNSDDTERHGHRPHGERKQSHKLRDCDVREIRLIRGHIPDRRLGIRYGVSHTIIRKAALKITWGHVTEGFRGQ